MNMKSYREKSIPPLLTSLSVVTEDGTQDHYCFDQPAGSQKALYYCKHKWGHVIMPQRPGLGSTVSLFGSHTFTNPMC